MNDIIISNPELPLDSQLDAILLNIVEREPGKFKIVATDGGFVDDHIRTVDHDGEQIELMSIQLAEAFLALTAITKSKLLLQEASLSAHKITSYYPPAVVQLDDPKKHIRFGYTRMELNRLYSNYLMVICDLDPIHALDKHADKSFWRTMFRNPKTNLDLPGLYGKPEDRRIAKLIQRKQTIDLVLVKRELGKLILEETVSELFSDDKIYSPSEISILANEYSRCEEIILELIDEIIDQPRAESWLSTPTLFKYNSEWLRTLWQRVLHEIRQWQIEEKSLSFKHSIEYPVLFFSGQSVLKIDEDANNQITITDNQLIKVLIRKAANEVEMIHPILAEFFLTSVGIKKCGLPTSKAQELAYHIVTAHAFYIAPELPCNSVFTRFDLHKLCLHYLSDFENNERVRRRIATEELDKFRWSFFPDACSTYNPLPKLTGDLEQIKRALPLRNRRFADSIGRRQAIIRFIKKLVKNEKYPEEFLQAYKFRLVNYLDNIFERNCAEEWIQQSAEKYDRKWLRQEMQRIWEIAQNEWERKQCDLELCSELC